MAKTRNNSRALDKTFALARTHIDTGDIAAAEGLLKQVIAQNPGHAGAYYYLGRIARGAGFKEHATPLLEEAVRLEPHNVEYLIFLSRHLVSCDQKVRAEAVLRSGLIHNPQSSELAKFLSRIETGATPDSLMGADEMRRMASVEQYPQLRAHSEAALQEDEGNLLARYYYGIALLNTGSLDEAIRQLQIVVQQEPDNDQAWGQLGIALMDKGAHSQSLAAHERALMIKPGEAVHHINAGVAYLGLGALREAETHARKALSLKGDAVAAIVLLGKVAVKLYHYEKATQLFRKALALKPDHTPAMTSLAELLLTEGKLQDAEWECRRLILMRRGMIEAYNTLVDSLTAQQKYEEALEYATLGVQQQPNERSVRNRLGICYLNSKRFADSIATYEDVLRTSPEYFASRLNLAGVSSLTGDRKACKEYYAAALESPEAGSEHFSNWIFAHLYDPEVSAAELLEVSRSWARQRLGDVTAYQSWNYNASPGAPLRLGIVSGDLRDHPVGFFLESVLARLTAMGVEIYLYSTVLTEDATSKRFTEMADKWVLCYKDGPDGLASKIHDDEVNVLIDVSGHTSHNRLAAFARKPAPVQITWLGYLSTTGLDAIDYIIGDPWVTPPEEHDHFVEEPLVLPNTYQCLSQPHDSPDVASLPALENNLVTFGSFNNFAKLNDGVIKLWAEVLKAVEGSRLLLKNQVLTDPVYQEKLRKQFVGLGVDSARLLFEPSRSREHILESYGRVDIGLDPFPYTGCTTSFESLWMGVPVITRTGNRFLSHAGESIMNNLEMPDWIAASAEEYVQIAVDKASDLNALASTRANLRERLISSPLMDSDAFAQQLHDALQDVWGRWLQEHSEAALASK